LLSIIRRTEDNLINIPSSEFVHLAGVTETAGAIGTRTSICIAEDGDTSDVTTQFKNALHTLRSIPCANATARHHPSPPASSKSHKNTGTDLTPVTAESSQRTANDHDIASVHNALQTPALNERDWKLLSLAEEQLMKVIEEARIENVGELVVSLTFTATEDDESMTSDDDDDGGGGGNSSSEGKKE